ncbi:MAG: AAA family ATPase [Candidatus Methanomethylophilaceae archaeon]|nr:AAA family ATPase [Candidatus Methanomethylophilaceae archaeon]
MEILREIKKELPNAIIGQSTAQREIIAALYDVAKGNYDKPCVMLFYGNTGVGKTETAKFIATKLNEGLFRKQFSMLHSEEFASYIFGGKHNQNSFAKELLERESNIILLDEFDKPNPVFYSAFYQLFDEGVFTDKNYTVSMKNTIIICTSNFKSETQICERLGDPIFSRFDAIVHFSDLHSDGVKMLLEREIDKQFIKLDENEKKIIDSKEVKLRIMQNARYLSNARQIKKYVREAFTSTIVDEIL